MAATSRIVLGPLSALYGLAARTRLALYRRGLLSVHQVSVPVISVGNITTGGTGKTPLVAWLARHVANEHGRRPCILTRGYGRANPNRRVLVSDGERLLADANEGGDEPRLLAEKLLGFSAVLCDSDRVGGARWAQKSLHSDLFILDDGFQHLRLARDLNIVTIDAMNPWGGGHLLPSGRLREAVSGLERADCCVITRSERASDVDSLRREIEQHSGGRPIFLACERARGLQLLTSAAMNNRTHVSPLAPLLTTDEVPKRVSAFCALGNPQAFFAQLSSEGFSLRTTSVFTDHHINTPVDIERLERDAMKAGAEALLTTAKDGVKLRSLDFQLPCYVFEIEMEFEDEPGFSQLVSRAIEERSNRLQTL